MKIKLFLSILILMGLVLANGVISQAGRAKLIIFTSCMNANPINVTVDGQPRGTLSSRLMWRANPVYGQSGTISIMVDVGTHSISATDGKYNWNPTINVSGNGLAYELDCN